VHGTLLEQEQHGGADIAARCPAPATATARVAAVNAEVGGVALLGSRVVVPAASGPQVFAVPTHEALPFD
jgi:hypothetical protein